MGKEIDRRPGPGPGLRERTLVEAFPAVQATLRPQVPPAPVVLAGGRLHGMGHEATGRVAVYRVDGRLLLRFEDVDVQGTPTPVVHLVAAGRRSPSGGARIGRLKAEHGSFGYVLGDAARVERVLVWCQRYAVPIAAADLAPVR